MQYGAACVQLQLTHALNQLRSLGPRCNMLVGALLLRCAAAAGARAAGAGCCCCARCPERLCIVRSSSATVVSVASTMVDSTFVKFVK